MNFNWEIVAIFSSIVVPTAMVGHTYFCLAPNSDTMKRNGRFFLAGCLIFLIGSGVLIPLKG